MAEETRPRIALCLALVSIALVCLVQLEEQPYEHTLMRARTNQVGGISAVSPRQGPFHGGSEVTIDGTDLCSGGLNDIAAVYLHGVPVQQVLSATATKIVVRTGALDGSEHRPGEGSVEVVSHSHGRAVAHHMYAYQEPPQLFAVQPDNGAHKGGTAITIQGRQLCSMNHPEDSLSVQVCDKPTTAVHCTEHGVVATTPAFDATRSSSTVCDVLVQSQVFGRTSAHRGFSYRSAPVITHVTPREGRLEGGNRVRIHGADITAGQGRVAEQVSVRVGGKAATVLGYTPSEVEIEIPSGLQKAGFVAITVNSHKQGTSTASGMYRLHPAPIITSLSRSSGRANGGERITLEGHGLGRGDVERVRFGERHATVLYADPRGREVRVITPPFLAQDEGRALPVTLESRGLGHTTLSKAFTVTPRGAIHGVSPAAGPAHGGTLLTITGTKLGTNHLSDFALAKINGVRASIVAATPTQVVVRTPEGAPGASGDVQIYSRHHGISSSPRALHFTYSRTPQLTSVKPAMSTTQGGDQVVLEGHRLCNAACSDLEFIQVGNAKVSTFVSKSPQRLVFHAPPMDAAGGAGAKTVAVFSREHGRAEAADAFLYMDGGAAGTAWPKDGPLDGDTTVTITGPDLGSGEEYRVLLAGVEAKVLSASPRKIEVQPGDARAYAKANGLDASQGLEGAIIIEVVDKGQARGMDTGMRFRYNAPCRLDRVHTVPGPADGDQTLVLLGHHLGLGDEQVFVDGQPSEEGLTVRSRQGSDVHKLAVRSVASTTEPAEVVIKSRRSGKCVWHRTDKVPMDQVLA